MGFLLMPAVWSVPEALVAAELSTAFPSNGGYVTWVTVHWPNWPQMVTAWMSEIF